MISAPVVRSTRTGTRVSLPQSPGEKCPYNEWSMYHIFLSPTEARLLLPHSIPTFTLSSLAYFLSAIQAAVKSKQPSPQLDLSPYTSLM